MKYINSITEAIGHTPLLKLNRIGKDAGANVLVAGSAYFKAADKPAFVRAIQAD